MTTATAPPPSATQPPPAAAPAPPPAAPPEEPAHPGDVWGARCLVFGLFLLGAICLRDLLLTLFR
jgi:hypothetical protein